MSFFPITSVPHLLNNHFHQKQAFRTCWTTIFIKNKRSALAEQPFSSKASVPHLLNNHFHQKQAFRTPRIIIFIKNRRASLPEQSFLPKTDKRHSPNNHFYQKQTSVTPRTIIFKNKHTNAMGIKAADWASVRCYSTSAEGTNDGWNREWFRCLHKPAHRVDKWL